MLVVCSKIVVNKNPCNAAGVNKSPRGLPQSGDPAAVKVYR